MSAERMDPERLALLKKYIASVEVRNWAYLPDVYPVSRAEALGELSEDLLRAHDYWRARAERAEADLDEHRAETDEVMERYRKQMGWRCYPEPQPEGLPRSRGGVLHFPEAEGMLAELDAEPQPEDAPSEHSLRTPCCDAPVLTRADATWYQDEQATCPDCGGTATVDVSEDFGDGEPLTACLFMDAPSEQPDPIDTPGVHHGDTSEPVGER